MSKDKVTWDDLYEQFKRRFPTMGRYAVTYHPDGPDRILVLLCTGDRVLYYGIPNRVEFIVEGNYYNGTIPDEIKKKYAPKKSVWRILGQNIVEQLKEKDMTQRELAKKIKVSDAVLSRYISKDRKMPLDTLVDIAKVLDCTLDELVKERRD